MPKADNPMYAKIVTIREWKTVAGLNLFGQEIYREFTRRTHEMDALEWVKKWNTHLDAEWESIRGTSADIMQRFVRALEDAGVSEYAIQAAMKEVKAYADA